jgi:hypothetical protein
MKPFRFGVNVWSAPSRVEWADKARKLEDFGYSALTVPDHLANIFAPMPALVAAAEATKRLQVGTNVLNVVDLEGDRYLGIPHKRPSRAMHRNPEAHAPSSRDPPPAPTKPGAAQRFQGRKSRRYAGTTVDWALASSTR